MPRTIDHSNLRLDEEGHIRPAVTTNRIVRSPPARCRSCGCENSIRADYTEEVYGTASVINSDGDLDDYDNNDSGEFTVTGYRCIECDVESSILEEVILGDGEEYEEDDNG
jgi:hypothetical protein